LVDAKLQALRDQGEPRLFNTADLEWLRQLSLLALE
jgi:hypothetical protein